MKYLSLLFLIIFLQSCEDKVLESSIEYVDRPTACPPGNPENDESEFDFSGLTNIESIQRTSAKVSWQASTNFSQFYIISVNPWERNILKTVEGTESEALIKGLTPDTQYTLLVRGVDKRGFLETNTKKMSFKTRPWPTYSNLKSLRFNGKQAIMLGKSKSFNLLQSFTLSFWLKDNMQANLNETERVFTFHSGNKAGSFLSLALKGQFISLYYKNKNRKLREFSYEFEYADSNWHHFAITYNKNFLTVYIDGKKAFKIKEQLIKKLGKHPAHIGAYTGLQQNLTAVVDEFGIFSASFNSLEIEELFNKGSANNLKDHSRGAELMHWYRFGDHVNDGESNIEDNQGNLNAIPFGVSQTDYSNDSP